MRKKEFTPLNEENQRKLFEKNLRQIEGLLLYENWSQRIANIRLDVKNNDFDSLHKEICKAQEVAAEVRHLVFGLSVEATEIRELWDNAPF